MLPKNNYIPYKPHCELNPNKCEPLPFQPHRTCGKRDSNRTEYILHSKHPQIVASPAQHHNHYRRRLRCRPSHRKYPAMPSSACSHYGTAERHTDAHSDTRHHRTLPAIPLSPIRRTFAREIGIRFNMYRCVYRPQLICVQTEGARNTRMHACTRQQHAAPATGDNNDDHHKMFRKRTVNHDPQA